MRCNNGLLWKCDLQPRCREPASSCSSELAVWPQVCPSPALGLFLPRGPRRGP